MDCWWGLGVPGVFADAEDAGVAGKGAGVVAVVAGVLAGVVSVVDLAHFLGVVDGDVWIWWLFCGYLDVLGGLMELELH